MQTAVLSLGTNLGDRLGNMEAMIKQCQTLLDGPIKISSLMETEPVGVPDRQQWYYNCIVSGFYGGSSQELLLKCQNFEIELGRTQKGNCASRIADIDILLLGDEICEFPDLKIPHSEILNRKFCIEGIFEILPDLIHPVLRKSFKEIHSEAIIKLEKQKIKLINRYN